MLSKLSIRFVKFNKTVQFRLEHSKRRKKNAIELGAISRWIPPIWYHCDLSKIPLDLSSKFIELGPDDETIKFLQQSEEKSDWILTQIWHSVVKAFLGWFMTQTSINGWLQRGSMFVLSLQQFLKLLRVEDSWHKEALLDLGAGDGEVTAHLASLFDKTYVTEVSTTMRTLLQNRGYSLLDIDSWHQTRKFDLISCLNLLDRCDTPNQLLAQIKTSLKPDGLVLLAVVLPFSAYVEAGSRDHRPTELLPIVGSCFEEQVKSVVDDVLTPAGYEVVSWTRVPYLCEGDLQQSYYWLDDVVFVLKVAN
ncbi:protein-L-histidine N-pros-methyltransferase isoform X2 [Tribolium castaneum]|uniref:protein-L-histidine N-pros-methyltransferase isoform X2 n=1 Tax=Tribolium castaneum TaxID=7070 RepID=UPI00046C31C1|nr:PREDICTED: methyltransferase-like protein 9 isoform X2 [Tribolium castaneum]|eukprot:XP_008191413.1 PREDICTED: methyltransferase-like protein 9 isoform X2 [Tribolium castaneum]